MSCRVLDSIYSCFDMDHVFPFPFSLSRSTTAPMDGAPAAVCGARDPDGLMPCCLGCGTHVQAQGPVAPPTQLSVSVAVDKGFNSVGQTTVLLSVALDRALRLGPKVQGQGVSSFCFFQKRVWLLPFWMCAFI